MLANLEEAIQAVKAYLQARDFRLEDVLETKGFQRNKAIIDAKEAVNQNDESRKRFEIICREVFKKFKACLTIQEINRYRRSYDAINIIYKSLQENVDKADISDIIRALHRIIEESIEASASVVKEDSKLYNMRKIDFERLKKEFERSPAKHTIVHSLKDRVDRKLLKMLLQNPTCTDFQKHYEEIVEEYNREKDRVTIEQTFEALLKLVREFVKALFRIRANLLGRSEITFFTTNYDTLLEDALSLEKYPVVDGFSGGAVGYWNPQAEFAGKIGETSPFRLFKLHGSVDWHKDFDVGLVRARYGTKYFEDLSDIMIYPQATKYVETQKDPFAYMFSSLRATLNSKSDNTLLICGYSFGDDHINLEIETVLSSPLNKTNLIVFGREHTQQDIVINRTLDKWLVHPQFGNRVYVATQKGLYYNDLSPSTGDGKNELEWWSFAGLTEFIGSGEI